MMANYLRNMIKGLLEQIVGRAVTPVGEKLFDLMEGKEARPLEEESAVAFHYTTAELIIRGGAIAMGQPNGSGLLDHESEVTRQR